MKCIKCGAYVYQSDKFCRSCGTELTNDDCQYGDNIPNSKYDSSSCHEQQYNYSYEYSNKTTPTYNMNATHEDQYNYNTNYSYDTSKYDYDYKPNDSGEDKYIKEFIGPNYNSIKNMKFSLPALIFGPMYLIYRKIWGFALLTIIIELAAVFLLNSDLSQTVSLIINIYLGFKFQSIYMKQVEDKVEQIKQQGLDKSTTELLEVCKKKGGTTMKGVVAAIFVSIVLYIALIIYLIGSGGFNLEEDLETVDLNNQLQTHGQVDKLYYTLPNGYTRDYSTDSANIYTYYQNNINCSVKIETRYAYGTNSDSSTYLKNINYPSTGVYSIQKNNYEWLYSHFQKTNFTEAVYVRKHNDKLYIVTMHDPNNYYCSIHYDEILNSLTFSRL